MKTTGIIVIALAMLITLTGVAMADQPIPATPEVQVVSTATSMNVMGDISLVQSLAWTDSNLSLPVTYVTNPLLADTGIQYTTAYDQNLVGLSGITSLNKQLGVDTQNKVQTQSNVKAVTQVNFLGLDGGNIVGSENIMIDGAGRNTTVSDRMICPFSAVTNARVPAYCNIFQAGSRFDLSEGAVTAQADDRFISASIDPPVELNYQVTVKGFPVTGEPGPAIGSVGSYAKFHIQEARGVNETKSEDIVGSHTASAAGYISSYGDSIRYTSQVTSVAVATPTGTIW